MRTVIWFTYFWASLLGLLPSLRRAQALDDAGRRAECDDIVQTRVRHWASTLLRLAGVEVLVSGLENIPPNEAVVFAGNHQGNFDIPILLSGLDRAHALLAKIETAKIPLVRSWMKLLGCVFLDRKDPRQAVLAIRESGARLAEGRSIIIFPEGTRSRGDTVGEFKAGAFKIASKYGAKVIPIVMDGSYRVMEAHHNWIHPATVRLTVLPAIETAGASREVLKALPEQVREQIVQTKSQK